nr:MFS transporter [Rhodococcus sp. LB1]
MPSRARLPRSATQPRRTVIAPPLSSLFTNPAVVWTYVGSGLQMFTSAVLLAWMPSFFNRYYGLAPDRAGVVASAFVLLIGSGMVVCGVITDRVSRETPATKWTSAIIYCVIALGCLGLGFSMGNGPVQLVLIGIGAFFSAGSSGPAAAMVANLTHTTLRASAMGVATIANSLLGLALGPFVIGILADHLGLLDALRLSPLAYIPAALALLLGRRLFPAGLRKLQQLRPGGASNITN